MSKLIPEEGPVRKEETAVPSVDLLVKEWLAEYGYDVETQTIRVQVKPGVVSFLIGLSQLTGESPKDALARLIFEQLRAIINGNMPSKVVAAIEEAYFEDETSEPKETVMGYSTVRPSCEKREA